jgi:hypothetical protein
MREAQDGKADGAAGVCGISRRKGADYEEQLLTEDTYG